MKPHFVIHLIVLLLAAVAPPHACQGDVDQGWIVNYLMDLGLLLKNGYPAAGIPQTDPLPLHLHFNVANDMFSGTMGLDGELSGFSNYFVSNATLNPNLYVNFDLIFYSTTFQGTYALDASAYKGIVPLSGGGPITIYFSFVELAANGTLIGQNQMVQLKDFDFKIKQINAIQVMAEGILKEYGLDAVLEVALQNSLGTAIKLFKPELEDFIVNYVMGSGNLALRNVTLNKIFEIIKEMTGVGIGATAEARSKREVQRRPPTGLAIQRLWQLFPYTH